MKGAHIILFTLLAGILPLAAGNSSPTNTEKTYEDLIGKSAINLNASSPLPEDSIINLCRRVETLSNASHNPPFFFKSGQIQVNSYALKGDLGQAAAKAQQLLDKAFAAHDELGIGLAIQAIGDTYMFTNRFEQADSIFNEAKPYVTRHGDPTMQIQLLLQHLHVQYSLSDTVRMQHSISQIGKMLEQNKDLPELFDYSLLLTCYEGFYAIKTGNTEHAQLLLQELEHKKPADGLFDIWVYDLASKYHESTGAYTEALIYADSTLQDARQQTNSNLLRNVLFNKAKLLEKNNMAFEACKMYQDIFNLGDSINASRYTAQIDTLRMTYWVDHMRMDNITRSNKAYTKIIGGLIFILIITAIVIVFIRRRNRMLEASRQELEAMRKASADSIRSKSLFLSNMSHELRTPLNAIMGFSTILTEDEQVDEETRQQCSDYIRQNADLLMKLINDVVDFSELRGDSIKFSFADSDVVMLCRNVMKTIQNVKRTEAELQFVTEVDQLELCTDKNRLQQVLINLMINATKFTKTGSITLRLQVDADHDEAIFTVEDTGCGIPLDRQPRIFERFEKLHEGVQGAGLGLSICKLIVEYVGGRIWVDPQYTQGARFIFTHPLHFTPKKHDA